MPPFCVVHANKAFCMFSGKSSGDVIGKPIESIVQVVQDISASKGPCEATDPVVFLESRLFGSNQNCQARVIPVMDHSRCNPREGMSHLLIKIQASQRSSNTAEQEAVAAAVIEAKLEQEEEYPNRIFGTVG
jgi:hypothetical protein